MLTIRMPWWLAAAACLAFVGLAVARAQDPPPPPDPPDPPARSEYPYLPIDYSQFHIPSVAEWRALQLNALGSSQARITESFSRHHLNCFLQPNGIILTLDLSPEAAFPHYAGDGRFSVPTEEVQPALQEAVDAALRMTRTFFAEIKDEHLQVRIFINGEAVGDWTGGTLRINPQPEKDSSAGY